MEAQAACTWRGWKELPVACEMGQRHIRIRELRRHGLGGGGLAFEHAHLAANAERIGDSGDLIGESRHRKGAAPELGVVIDKVIP